MFTREEMEDWPDATRRVNFLFNHLQSSLEQHLDYLVYAAKTELHKQAWQAVREINLKIKDTRREIGIVDRIY
jgi:hypothetical protein